MNTTPLPYAPADAVKRLSESLPSRRMRDVFVRRFGLKGGHRATLEEIGQTYKITRERVRQIEADAMRRIRTGNGVSEIEPLYRVIRETLAAMGGIAASQRIFGAVADKRHHPHLRAILHFNPTFVFFPEDENFFDRWATDKTIAEQASHTVRKIAEALDEKKQPVLREELLDMARAAAQSAFPAPAPEEHLVSYLESTKLIKTNPYGEYGLAAWPAISPRGIRDKAYAALRHEGKPAHFRQVASLIDRGGWSRKKVHPQTAHNELIKDKRFVLVGRGMYALSEWGYEAGSVRDIIASLLKESPRALTRDEIVALASEKRMVKPQTILLNLQNRDFFQKTADGKYALL